MKQLLITIAAVILVGCGESQQSATATEAEPIEPLAETAKPEPPTVKAPAISIHEAASEGNIEAFKQHLAAGTNVNEKDDEDWTPLHYAAFNVNKEIAELLIAKGADVNAKDMNEWTPLHWATDIIRLPDQKEIAKLLIEKGADVNAKNDDVETPLHFAAVHHKQVAELLIAKGSDVNAKDIWDQTPLDNAINPLLSPHHETADLLRKHGGKTGEELKAAGN